MVGVPSATLSPSCLCAQCEAAPCPTVTGEIRRTSQLEVAHARLLIQAYNALHPADHATTVLNVTVQGTDRWAPSCIPAIFV